MGILAWIAFGLVVGLIARALMPGSQKMGLIWTTLLGIVGSFAGGTIANLLVGQRADTLAPAGFIGSILGAMAVLAIAIFFFRRRGVGAIRAT
jgi:uncharacterized membrane protein YeaQ/YmgE (transglycosylase-associated protein family)